MVQIHRNTFYNKLSLTHPALDGKLNLFNQFKTVNRAHHLITDPPKPRLCNVVVLIAQNPRKMTQWMAKLPTYLTVHQI